MNAVSAQAAASGALQRARSHAMRPASDIKFCAIDEPDCEACQ